MQFKKTSKSKRLKGSERQFRERLRKEALAGTVIDENQMSSTGTARQWRWQICESGERGTKFDQTSTPFLSSVDEPRLN